MLPQPAFPGVAAGRLRTFANGLPIDPSMQPSAVHALPSCTQSPGSAGLNPFVVLADMLRQLPATKHIPAAFDLKTYGATVTRFPCAILLGLALRDHTTRTNVLPIAWGVVPSPLAWLAQVLAAAGRTR